MALAVVDSGGEVLGRPLHDPLGGVAFRLIIAEEPIALLHLGEQRAAVLAGEVGIDTDIGPILGFPYPLRAIEKVPDIVVQGQGMPALGGLKGFLKFRGVLRREGDLPLLCAVPHSAMAVPMVLHCALGRVHSQALRQGDSFPAGRAPQGQQKSQA